MEKKYLEAINKREEEMVSRLNDSITSLLSLLRNGDEKTGVPFNVYSEIFTQVLNMHISPDNKKKLQGLLSKQITSFMSDKIIPAFKGSKETGRELVDKFIKNWLITSKLKLWMEKICKYLNFETDPSAAIFLIFTQNVFEEKTVQTGLISFLVDYFKKKGESKPSKDEFVSSADTEHIQKYGFSQSAIFELSVDVQQLLSIVAEMGKEPTDFDEDKEFSKYVGNYLQKIVDEKRREEAMTEYYNSQGTGGNSYGGGESSYSGGGGSSYSSYRDYLDEDDTTSLDNAEFFQGKKGSKFGDGTVDKILKEWRGRYDEMEDRHNYVQFFFPIRESGMSSQQALTKHESELFKKDSKMRDNLIGIYELMLDFYGIKLKDRSTGEVERNKNWESRYKNLNDNGHNNLRVTRILKCLGLTGLEHFKKHLLKLFITEVFQNKQLENVKSSLVKYWLPTLRNEADLIEVEELVKKITGKRISRKVYDKEKRTWANVVFPLKKEEKKDEKEDEKKDEKQVDKKDKKDDDDDDGKTFYNRDDDDKSESESILDASSPRRKFFYNWNNDDDDDDNKNDGGNYSRNYYNDSSDSEDLDNIDEELEEDFEKKYS